MNFSKALIPKLSCGRLHLVRGQRQLSLDPMWVEMLIGTVCVCTYVCEQPKLVLGNRWRWHNGYRSTAGSAMRSQRQTKREYDRLLGSSRAAGG
jgi:hypothetical protein